MNIPAVREQKQKKLRQKMCELRLQACARAHREPKVGNNSDSDSCDVHRYALNNGEQANKRTNQRLRERERQMAQKCGENEIGAEKKGGNDGNKSSVRK